jgi:hypothetical protein
VFIHPDQSKEERLANGYLRMLVNAINKGGSLIVKGNRVFNSSPRSRTSMGSNAPSAFKGNNATFSRSNHASNSETVNSVTNSANNSNYQGHHNQNGNRQNNNGNNSSQHNFQRRGGGR